MSDIVNMSSNILVNDGKIYFSSKNTLFCLNMEDGDVIWKNPLSEKETSAASIFIQDNYLCLINKGTVSINGNNIPHGKAYIAVYNINSGKQELFQLIFDDKKSKEFILDVQMRDQEVYLLTKNRIMKYAFPSGDLLEKKSFDEEIDEYDSFLWFIGDRVSDYSNSTLQSVTSLYSSDICIATENEKVIVMDDSFLIKHVLDFKDLYILDFVYDDLKFFRRDNHMMIYNSDNQYVTEFETVNRMRLADNKLYGIEDKELVIYDLSSILKSSYEINSDE